MSIGMYLPWQGDVIRTDAGGYGTTQGVSLAVQYFARRLLSNPAVYDAQGNMIQPGDDPFDPTYGEGLGQLIGQPNTPDKLATMEALVLSGATKETLIDQTQPVTVQFLGDPSNGQLLVMQVSFTTIDGSTATFGVPT